MANYLNAGILGDGTGVANRRGFRAIPTEYIDTPAYNAKYFEAYPTVWACAYAFSKMLASEGDQAAAVQPNADRARAAEAATEEWACLFLLYFFGDLHLVSYDRAKLEKEYDRDLWVALSGTYPESGEQAVREIQLLETDADTVVGGYYPETVFFPSRGRSTWARDRKLAAYLDETQTRLSWEKCGALLLRGERERRDFQEHLELVARHALPSKVFQDRLRDFSARNFFDRVDPNGTLPSNPADWPAPVQLEPADFLRIYPLQKPNQRWGTTYYLIEKMRDKTEWMTVSTAAGWPAPHQYVESGNNQISVPYRGRQIVCHLSDNDDIVHLHKFFLADSPHWCKIPKASDAHTARIKSLHKIELRDPALTDQDLAVCLAPLASGFLEQFPEILNNLDQIRTTIDWQGTVEWSFPVMGKEVRWRTRPTLSRALSGTTLSMWPPRVSRQWHLYAAYGFGGKKKDRGLWNLVDEYGQEGKLIEIEEDEEYFSVLQRSNGKPNRPKALLLRDGEGEKRERGVLFLSEFQEATTSGDGTATLAVDFGTSNTCLAYNDGESRILDFKLSPEILWGKRLPYEVPGFVPFNWGGQKGFFPTILLSRLSDTALSDELHPDNVTLEHLFKVDIPGLHWDIEQRLSEGEFNRVWKMHANPKWETARTRPWRTLFLELTLLYAHAELFFHRGVKLDKYVFTFPLAFSKPEQDNFHEKAQAALRKIREYCYGTTPATDHFDYEHRIDESTAIAESVGAAANSATMDVFIDIGGGTADIAIRYNGRYLVLDSLKVAGNTFFRFADRNFRDDVYGAAEFKQHLARLLQGRDDGSEFRLKSSDKEFSLGVRYSVAINALDDAKFREREMNILKMTMGSRSYQKYRTRLLFRHVMTYALLQACAAVVEQRAKLSSGIKLVLGGNAWGLLMFADIPRSAKRLTEEAGEILNLLKHDLLPTLGDEERPYLENEKLRIASLELLNETNLSKAKTNVALGALKANANKRNGDQRTPYAGITISNLKLNDFEPRTLRWYDRWGFDEFKSRYGFMDRVDEASFESPEDLERPIDTVLSVFTRAGNTRNNKEDNMPPDIWVSMNGKLSESVNNLQGEQTGPTPINYFISEVLYPQDAPRDFLDDLAAKNGQLRPNSDEE